MHFTKRSRRAESSIKSTAWLRAGHSVSYQEQLLETLSADQFVKPDPSHLIMPPLQFLHQD